MRNARLGKRVWPNKAWTNPRTGLWANLWTLNLWAEIWDDERGGKGRQLHLWPAKERACAEPDCSRLASWQAGNSYSVQLCGWTYSNSLMPYSW